MYSKKEPKYYHVDEENRKLYLSEDANMVLNKLNRTRRIINEARVKNTFKNDFKGAYANENSKVG